MSGSGEGAATESAWSGSGSVRSAGSHVATAVVRAPDCWESPANPSGTSSSAMSQAGAEQTQEQGREDEQDQE
eukprot:1782047-Alexandrium_andersonii.AAC.1